ncbi:MAG: hypothetical protein V9G13_11175 [Marmoricola sp.]
MLHRSPELRKSQIFASADWPGYTMLNTTMQSTKSGGPLAGAWAVLNTIGEEGYLRLTEKVLAGVDALVEGVNAIPVLSLVAQPDSTLVAFTTDDSCDVFTIADELHRAGWWTQPQLSFAGQPANLHLTLSAATDVDDFLQALGQSVQTAVTSGPVVIDEGIREFVASLDPSALSDADFDGLLAAVGMGGASGGWIGRRTGLDGRDQRPPRHSRAPAARVAVVGVPRSAAAAHALSTPCGAASCVAGHKGLSRG